MRLVDDPETAEWLAGLSGRSEDFDWDAGNRTKIRKHEVEQRDVEALFSTLWCLWDESSSRGIMKIAG